MISKVAVAAYDAELELEQDVKTLQRGGFDMTRVCVIGRDCGAQGQPLVFLHSGRRSRFFGRYGTLWSTLSGILFAAALVSLAQAEHFVILGPLATHIVAALRGPAPGGAGRLAAALKELGIPEGAALAYEAALRGQQFLLIIQADARGIQQARELLERTHLETF